MQKPLPQRKSPRLKGYDYSQHGAYFVTLVTHLREHLFGIISDGDMRLSPTGKIAAARWFTLPEHHLHVELDAFVVMPNHVHGIIMITGISHADNAGVVHTQPVGTRPASSVKRPPQPRGAKPDSIGAIVGSYKSGVTRRVREAVGDPHLVVWQGRYHDRIIRSQREYDYIRAYVTTNPSRWDADALNR